MVSPKLSICIPTFNRFQALSDLLAVVIPQCRHGQVEMCIADNASTDGSSLLIEQLGSRHSFLSHHIQARNIGFPGNLLSCLDMARGDYVWMLGDDERLYDDSVGRILKFLEGSQVSLLMLNFNRQVLCREGALSTNKEFAVADDIIDASLDSILQVAGAWASLMSVNVMRRCDLVACLEQEDVLKTSNYLGFELSMFVGARGRCSLLSVPVLERLNNPVGRHRFDTLETYADDFFRPVNVLLKRRVLTRKTYHRLTIYMYRRMIAYLLVKNKYNKITLPGIAYWMKNHQNINFWLFVFPVLLLPRVVVWLLVHLVSILPDRVLNKYSSLSALRLIK